MNIYVIMLLMIIVERIILLTIVYHMHVLF
jgi:hypothetical protein